MLAGEFQAIFFDGQTYEPNPTRGYVEFRCAHTMPVVNEFGCMLHPAVIARSYQTMLHQQFNLNHQMRFWDKEKIANDRMLGAIVAVRFPPMPESGWKIAKTKEEAPGIQGVASLSLIAHGADRIVGEHKTGRKERTVSIEMIFDETESGFVVMGQDVPANLRQDTPQDIWTQSMVYIPWAKAPEEMRKLWNGKRIKGRWRNQDVRMLCGGIDNSVHFAGLGLVDIGFEKEACVKAMLAGSGEEDPAEIFSETMGSLLQTVQENLPA